MLTTVKPKDIKITEDIIQRINAKENSCTIPLLQDLDGETFEYNSQTREEEERADEIEAVQGERQTEARESEGVQS